MKLLLSIAVLSLLLSCKEKTEIIDKNHYKLIGNIIKYDDELDAIIATETRAEIIAQGFVWSEGPLWLDQQQMLLFSDVPANTIYQWTEANGTQIYLTPSGYTGVEVTQSKEPGSNGLTLDPDGHLVLCQHGNRQVARMEAPLTAPMSQFTPLADQYKGKDFNSPNDAIFNASGELFFTDPPYGLPSQDDTDSTKELAYNGIYKVKKDGSVLLLADSISRPNGIALFPNEKRLIVASSDPAQPNWYVWEVEGDQLINGTIFHSAADHDPTWQGLPDGLKIDAQGYVYATGPGGIYFFNSLGKKLGILKLDNPTSNCALSPDQKTLYVTNDMYVLRISLQNREN
jgi:gluconolactonase